MDKQPEYFIRPGHGGRSSPSCPSIFHRGCCQTPVGRERGRPAQPGGSQGVPGGPCSRAAHLCVCTSACKPACAHACVFGCAHLCVVHAHVCVAGGVPRGTVRGGEHPRMFPVHGVTCRVLPPFGDTRTTGTLAPALLQRRGPRDGVGGDIAGSLGPPLVCWHRPLGSFLPSQVFPQVFPQMQPKLPEERWESPGYAALPGEHPLPPSKPCPTHQGYRRGRGWRPPMFYQRAGGEFPNGNQVPNSPQPLCKP